MAEVFLVVIVALAVIASLAEWLGDFFNFHRRGGGW